MTDLETVSSDDKKEPICRGLQNQSLGCSVQKCLTAASSALQRYLRKATEAAPRARTT